jgi:anti-anti-sigma factor
MNVQLLNNRTTKVIKMPQETETGELKNLKQELSDINGYTEVIIDLSDTLYIDSRFTFLLLQIKSENPRQYTRIKLVNPNRLVQSILDLTDLSRVFNVQMICPTAW